MISTRRQTFADYTSDQEISNILKNNNVNLVSGLATNYLNHYIEILALLEILADMPECFEDVRAWKPATYIEHVERSGLPSKDVVLKAYDFSVEERKQSLTAITQKANRELETLIGLAGSAIDRNDVDGLRRVAAAATEFISPLIERMSGIITPDPRKTTAFIDTV